jgi:hypothetical protein
MNEEDFYKECELILGVSIIFNKINLIPKVNWDDGTVIPTYINRGRWSGRLPGNGRIPGFGLIRWFSNKQIHICFKTPSINKLFVSPQQALDFLKKTC